MAKRNPPKLRKAVAQWRPRDAHSPSMAFEPKSGKSLADTIPTSAKNLKIYGAKHVEDYLGQPLHEVDGVLVTKQLDVVAHRIGKGDTWKIEDGIDPTNVTKNKPAKTYSEQEILEKRDALFENGSTFMPAHREDIVGIDNVLGELDQVIHWLRHANEYKEYGSRLEPGVIFEGSPGTGKTLVSRYIATESNALFVNVRDFAHESTLYKDSDIADLFKRARAYYAEHQRPVVLFWDEFEGAAIDRTEGTPEQVTTVSQITAELDGVHGKNEGILLIGCTNYIHGIDAALKRSGRMGLQIEFHAPDREGKRLLLEHYLKKYDIPENLDIDTLSHFFVVEATAADIEEACVEAWRYSVHRKIEEKEEKPRLDQDDLIKVFLKRLVGPPTTFINLPMKDRARVAVHECGHAIMAAVYDIPLRLITVQPGKKCLGRVITFETQEHIDTIDEWISHLRITLGSISAEKVANLAPLVGSTKDISDANRLAARLVDHLYVGEETKLMNPKAMASVRNNDHEYISPAISLSTIDKADNDVEKLLAAAQEDAAQVLENIGHDNLWEIANLVNEKVTLIGEDFKAELANILGTDDFSQFRSNVNIVKDGLTKVAF